MNPVEGFFKSLNALFNNQTPTLNPQQTGENSSGVVSGSLGAVDPDSPKLTYTATQPVHGSVDINPEDGTYTYTPDASWAHLTGGADTFTVTVSDASSGFAIHGLPGLLHLLTLGLIGSSGATSSRTINVTVAPVNQAPTLTLTTTPNADGTTTITATAEDLDGDTLSIAAMVSDGHGALTPTAGGYTFIPDNKYAHNLSVEGSTAPGSATVTITVSDGRGGNLPVQIPIAIEPSNTAPVTTTLSLGPPNTATGVVTGMLKATDPDGDSLNYTSQTITTSKGSVVLNATTGAFIYTPTAAARHAASATGAGATDKQDSFAITIDDTHGGKFTQTITVAILPANVEPIVTGWTGHTDSNTGVVTGHIETYDPDGDPITFAPVSMSGARGTLQVGADGVFTFTPTADARWYAANEDATVQQKTAQFNVSLNDNHYDADSSDDLRVLASSAFNTAVSLPIDPKRLDVQLNPTHVLDGFSQIEVMKTGPDGRIYVGQLVRSGSLPRAATGPLLDEYAAKFHSTVAISVIDPTNNFSTTTYEVPSLTDIDDIAVGTAGQIYVVGPTDKWWTSSAWQLGTDPADRPKTVIELDPDTHSERVLFKPTHQTYSAVAIGPSSGIYRSDWREKLLAGDDGRLYSWASDGGGEPLGTITRFTPLDGSVTTFDVDPSTYFDTVWGLSVDREGAMTVAYGTAAYGGGIERLDADGIRQFSYTNVSGYGTTLLRGADSQLYAVGGGIKKLNDDRSTTVVAYSTWSSGTPVAGLGAQLLMPLQDFDLPIFDAAKNAMARPAIANILNEFTRPTEIAQAYTSTGLAGAIPETMTADSNGTVYAAGNAGGFQDSVGILHFIPNLSSIVVSSPVPIGTESEPLDHISASGPTATNLYATLRDKTANGDGVYIEKIRSSDDTTRLVVYIGGTTANWVGPNQPVISNAEGWDNNVKLEQIQRIYAALGINDTPGTGVTTADNTPILLVGYSQGGMDAENIANQAASFGLMNVTTVITYGAPAVVSPIADVNMAFLWDNTDPVPNLSHLDALVNDAGLLFYGNGGVYTPADPLGINVHMDPRTYLEIGRQFDETTDPRFTGVLGDLEKFKGEVTAFSA